MERQTPKWMYYDYWESYKEQNVGELFFTNCFDKEFYFEDVDNHHFFIRMHIEADLEYLLVEGVYTNWQATGDTAYVREWLQHLKRE